MHDLSHLQKMTGGEGGVFHRLNDMFLNLFINKNIKLHSHISLGISKGWDRLMIDTFLKELISMDVHIPEGAH